MIAASLVLVCWCGGAGVVGMLEAEGLGLAVTRPELAIGDCGGEISVLGRLGREVGQTAMISWRLEAVTQSGLAGSSAKVRKELLRAAGILMESTNCLEVLTMN